MFCVKATASRAALLAGFLLSCLSAACVSARGGESPEGWIGEGIEVPLSFDLGVWPCVTVSVNGIDMELHLDTGDETSGISLSPEQLRLAGARALPGIFPSRTLDGELDIARAYSVSSVRVGGAETGISRVAVANERPGRFKPIGSVGLGFLEGYAVRVDYAEKTLSLFPRADSYDLTGFASVSLDGRYRFTARVPDAEASLVLSVDTGAIFVNGGHGFDWLRVRPWFGLPENARYGSFEGLTVIEGLRLSIGNAIAEAGPVLAYPTAEPRDRDGCLGFSFLAGHVAILDYPGRTLHYAPVGNR